jgi:hypothetical protein
LIYITYHFVSSFTNTTQKKSETFKESPAKAKATSKLNRGMLWWVLHLHSNTIELINALKSKTRKNSCTFFIEHLNSLNFQN